MQFDPKILSPLKDASFYTALSVTVAGEAAAFQNAHGVAVAVPMLVAMLPLLVWLRSHSKHRVAAIDALVSLAQLAGPAAPSVPTDTVDPASAE